MDLVRGNGVFKTVTKKFSSILLKRVKQKMKRTYHDVHVGSTVKMVGKKKSFNSKSKEGRGVIKVGRNIKFVKIENVYHTR